MNLQDATTFSYSHAYIVTLVLNHTHTPQKRGIYNSLELISVVSYILDKNFIMKYSPYEKYISIRKLEFSLLWMKLH